MPQDPKLIGVALDVRQRIADQIASVHRDVAEVNSASPRQRGQASAADVQNTSLFLPNFLGVGPVVTLQVPDDGGGGSLVRMWVQAEIQYLGSVGSKAQVVLGLGGTASSYLDSGISTISNVYSTGASAFLGLYIPTGVFTVQPAIATNGSGVAQIRARHVSAGLE